MPQNGINHAGVTALAEAMQHNPGLRILNLNDNTFTEKGAIAMAQVYIRKGLVVAYLVSELLLLLFFKQSLCTHEIPERYLKMFISQAWKKNIG